MQARLLENDRGLWLLFANGSMLSATKLELRDILFDFKTLPQKYINVSVDKVCKWNDEYPDISSVPGKTIAYITNTSHLVIIHFTPFVRLFEDVKYIIEEMETVYEYALKHNKSVEQVKILCRKGRITGATKVGRDWVIPKDAPYPFDRRLR